METVLLGIIFILLLVVSIFIFRLLCYQKQINHILKEITILKEEDTNYRLSSYCRIGKTESVISSINEIIENDKRKENLLKKENKIYKESITGISHDIRTPLTSAKGYIQMLQNEKIENSKKQEYIDIVKQRLDDVTNMLNQLFEYARIEAGEMEFEMEVLNAGNIFAETISMFYDDFLKNDWEPEVKISSTPCFILGDRQAFTRIIENLIRNALFHGTGEYKISLSQNENWMIIEVANKTNSIEEKDISRIFDRFYTTDQSRSKKTTGLGLAIVKRFTEQMGGSAEASLKEQYFTVKICIPLYKIC